ncbi:hypothetical protein [Chondrinema litorale]|uniref:hypothetical protein n=1 Tax=Chondrinema litorale TaxID=2994555 RepID=UPI0025435E33|nr:hypothetical protein [Chondrinema litorale]UZS00254.1 hypothetical protein OQ292_40650 [Chondrinema litorale]
MSNDSKEFNPESKMFDLKNMSQDEVIRLMYRDLHELKDKFDNKYQTMEKDIIELKTKLTVFSEINKSKPVQDNQWREWIRFIITIAAFIFTFFFLKK